MNKTQTNNGPVGHTFSYTLTGKNFFNDPEATCSCGQWRMVGCEDEQTCRERHFLAHLIPTAETVREACIVLGLITAYALVLLPSAWLLLTLAFCL